MYRGRVCTVEELREKYPDHTGLRPTDDNLTRLRYIVTLMNEDEQMIRVRSIQWTYGDMDRAECAEVASDWIETIMSLTSHYKPEDCPGRLTPHTQV